MCVGFCSTVRVKDIRERTRDSCLLLSVVFMMENDIKSNTLNNTSASPKRVHNSYSMAKCPITKDITKEDLRQFTKEELIEKLNSLNIYVTKLEAKGCESKNDQDSNGLCLDDKLRKHQAEAQRRENILVMRLATREQEVQDILNQLEELRTSLGGGLRNALLDPVVNSMFQKIRDELRQTKEKHEQSQQELSAWKFTSDSQTGKRLMARCRSLMQENEELGRMIEAGRLARLEGELNMSRKETQELRGGQSEVEELLVELDDDMEGLQATIMYLQQQLDAARLENTQLRHLVDSRSDNQHLVQSVNDQQPVQSVQQDPVIDRCSPVGSTPPAVAWFDDKVERTTISEVQQNGSNHRQEEMECSQSWTTQGLSPLPAEEAVAAATAVVDNRTELTLTGPPAPKQLKLDPETGDFIPQSPEPIINNSSLEEGEIDSSSADTSISAKRQKRTRSNNARTRNRNSTRLKAKPAPMKSSVNAAVVLQNGLDVSDGSDG